MNSALKVLLKQREQDKEIEENVHTNVKKLVLPYIEKLKKRKLGEDALYLISSKTRIFTGCYPL